MCNGHFGKKLRTYRQFKQFPQGEKYLTLIPSKQARKDLTKLRISTHNLNIERLRYSPSHTRVPPEERICNKCSLGEIEDEYHFIIICPHYKHLRRELFMTVDVVTKHFKMLTPHEKFHWLMTTEDQRILPKLARYTRP